MDRIFIKYDKIKDNAQELVDEYNHLLRKEILPYLSKYYKIIRSPDIKNKFLLKKILKKYISV